MPRFKVSATRLPSLPSDKPQWRSVEGYTVQRYMECDWERPVTMLLRNHFVFQRTEMFGPTMTFRAIFEAPSGDRVIFYHSMRHAEFRIQRVGVAEVREVFIDAHRLYGALRQHYSFQTARRATR